MKNSILINRHVFQFFIMNLFLEDTVAFYWRYFRIKPEVAKELFVDVELELWNRLQADPAKLLHHSQALDEIRTNVGVDFLKTQRNLIGVSRRVGH